MRIMSLFLAVVLSVSLLGVPALADGHGNHGNHGNNSGEGQKGSKGDRFARADSNGDGVISRDEFMALAGQRFSKMDADGNGSLSADEMRPKRRGSQSGQRGGYGR